MLHTSHPSPPATIAELVEALQKLPPEMHCTGVLTELEPAFFKDQPIAGGTIKLRGRMETTRKITITLEPWWPEKEA